jgi:ABC-type antimicrobial peptide transport system permease subunit
LEDLFPGQSGFVRLLVEVPPADEAAVREVLTSSLGEYGLIVEPAGQVLGRYSQVAQAYLSTFQLLGGLGLLLGTVGLAVVLLRNLIQRRSELMLLAAIGFTPARRAILILIQNAGLLLAGLAAGLMASLAALAAGGRAGSLNAAPLAATLLTILLVGLAVLTSAVYLGGQDIRPAQMGRE